MSPQMMKTRMCKCVSVKKWGWTTKSRIVWGERLQESEIKRQKRRKFLLLHCVQRCWSQLLRKKKKNIYLFSFPHLIFPLPLLTFFYFIIPAFILHLPLNCLPHLLLSHPLPCYYYQSHWYQVCSCHDSPLFGHMDNILIIKYSKKKKKKKVKVFTVWFSLYLMSWYVLKL